MKIVREEFAFALAFVRGLVLGGGLATLAVLADRSLVAFIVAMVTALVVAPGIRPKP